MPANIQRTASQLFFMDSVTLAFDDVNDFSGYQPLETAGAVPNRDVSISFTHPMRDRLDRQQRLEERSRPSRAERLARLPREWLGDYQHAVARRTVAAR